jgi:hypothetical protein
MMSDAELLLELLLRSSQPTAAASVGAKFTGS